MKKDRATRLTRYRMALSALMLGALASGCGQIINTHQDVAPGTSYQHISLTHSTPPMDDGYQCPQKDNVVPDYDYQFDGTGFFKVCVNPISNYLIKIHGSTPSGGAICVFPAQIVDSRHTFTKPDNIGAPMFTCYEINKTGIVADFEKTNFNAAFIVDEKDREQMQYCLMGGNYFACPKNYSFGRFR